MNNRFDRDKFIKKVRAEVSEDSLLSRIGTLRLIPIILGLLFLLVFNSNFGKGLWVEHVIGNIFANQFRGDYDYGYRINSAADFVEAFRRGKTLPTTVSDGMLLDVRIRNETTIEAVIKLKTPTKRMGANPAQAVTGTAKRLSCAGPMMSAAFKAGLGVVLNYYSAESDDKLASVLISAEECRRK